MLVVLLVLTLSSCKNNDDKVTVQLDYLINTNHTGLYVALDKGYFDEVGLEVEVLESGESDPLLSLATNSVDFAYSYQEYIMYALDAEDPLPIQAISAVIQNNTSGFIYKKSLNISSFNDFKGKTYGGWNSPIEESIISAIASDNNMKLSDIDMTVIGSEDVFTNLDGDIDFQWVFYGWDMTNAISRDIDDDYEFTYLQEYKSELNFYSPVIAAANDVDKDKATNFLSALNKGYEYSIENPEESAEILHSYANEYDLNHLIESQKYLATKYNEGNTTFGMMEAEKWNDFGQWLKDSDIISNDVDISKAYTNEYIK